MLKLYKKRSVGESMTDAFGFYKENFIKIVIILAILTLPLGILYIITMDNSSLNFSFTSFFLSMLVIFFLSVVQNFISPYIIKSYMENGNQLDIGVVINGFLKRYFSFLGLNIAYLGLLLAVYFASAFLVIIIAVIPALAVLVGFGVIALFVYMLIRYIYVYHIYAIENIDIGKAFSKAAKLIRGHWWETFGLGVIISVLYITAVAISMGVLSIFINFEDMLNLSGAVPVFSIWYYIVTIMLSIIFLPFAHMSFTMHYLNLIERTESKSVLNLVDDFGRDD